MRERLVIALVGMTVAVIALYGIPRAYFLADLVHDQEQHRVERVADLVAGTLAERHHAGRPVTQEFLRTLVGEGEGVRLTSPGHPSLTAGADRAGSKVEASSEVDGGERVTVWRSGDAVDAMVSEALLPLVLLGLGLLVLSAGIGFVLAGRLSRPFRRLAVAAERLGQGRFDADIPRSTIPEAEAIGSALRGAATQLDALVGREQHFAVHASHELLTPVAALRLELEDLSLWPQTPPDVARQLDAARTGLDRLSDALRDLLSRTVTVPQTTAIDLDLAALSGQVVEGWLTAAAAEGRELVHESSGVVAARVAPGVVIEVLDALVENALRHGAGRISVRADDLGTHLRVRVSDEGRRRVASDVLHGSSGAQAASPAGGMPRAAGLAEAVGGHLRVSDAELTTVDLMLPRRGAS